MSDSDKMVRKVVILYEVAAFWSKLSKACCSLTEKAAGPGCEMERDEARIGSGLC